MRKNTGFTLIELIVVLGIIGLLATAGVPLFRSIQPSVKLSAEARNISLDLRDSQQKSVTEQINYGVRFVPPNSYNLIKITGSEQTLLQKNLDSSVAIQSTTFADNLVQFNPYGAALPQGVVTLQNNAGKTMQVNVRPSGFIRIEQP